MFAGDLLRPHNESDIRRKWKKRIEQRFHVLVITMIAPYMIQPVNDHDQSAVFALQPESRCLEKFPEVPARSVQIRNCFLKLIFK